MDNAYSQLALCGPSRTSLLTSRLPERMQILSNTNLNWRENAKIKDVYSLPQYYKKHGYRTKSIGKIFHPIGKVLDKVKKIYEDSLDSMPSPSPSVKIQIIGGKGVKAKHCWALSTNI